MISAITKRLDEREEGFTLIELLVVVIIIGILAAIAIPVFLNQRERAWERAVMSDMRNASVALEEVFNDDGEYDAAFTAGTPYTITNNVVTSAENNDYPLVISEFVEIEAAGDGANGYELTGTHDNLDGRSWTLESTSGVVAED